MLAWLGRRSRRSLFWGALLVVGAAAGLGFWSGNWIGWGLLAGLAIGSVAVLRLVHRRVQREREQQLDLGLEAEPPRPEGLDPASAADLRERFRDALAEIRAHLRGGVYEMPWLAVLGESGAGKSLLLHECGLDVPARFARRGFGPTQSCEFVLSNDAVAIDTTGRWYRAESESERMQWLQFLRLLRQSRSECPLNAVLVALAAPALLARSAGELEDEGRELRRRLNELRVELGADVPVYLVITKTDAIEGFSETARGLPPQWLGQAFGWTCDQRRLADPEGSVERALSELAERIDALTPDLLRREPDPTGQRRLLCFSRELEGLGRGLGRLAGIAFKRDRYDETPFLRGVYLTSARSDGPAVSTALRRLGVAWADAGQPAGAGGPAFLRDLIHEVVCGDEPLALPDRRFGPNARRAIALAGSLTVAAVLLLWGTSFAQNWTGIRELAQLSRRAALPDPPLSDLARLRAGLEDQQVRASSPVQWLGFNRLGPAAERARRVFAFAFERSFHSSTRANLERALEDREERSVQATIVLANDIEFLARCGGEAGASPDWTAYLPRTADDAQSYREVYASHVTWLPLGACEDRLREAQQLFDGVSSGMLRLPRLEQMTQGSGALGAVDSASLGLRANPTQSVPGIYTLEGSRLFAQLARAIERSGSMSPLALQDRQRDYASRYYARWREFLFEAPLDAPAPAQLQDSPYLALIATVDEQTRAELPGDVPPWVELLRAVRRTTPEPGLRLPGSEEPPPPPWSRYEQALDAAALELEEALSDTEKALLLATDAAEGRPTALGTALDTAGQIVPAQGDIATRRRLRELLQAPVRGALARVLRGALRELDRIWVSEIVEPYRDASQEQLRGLLGPDAVAEQFRTRTLGPFFRAGQPRAILGELPLPFSPAARDWFAYARRVPPPATPRGAVTVVDVRGTTAEPERWPGEGDAYLKSWELSLVCSGSLQTQTLRADPGSTEKRARLRWSDESCTSVRIDVALVGPGAELETRVFDEWSTLSEFLGSAVSLGGDRRQWRIRGAAGTVVRVRYRIQTQAPPRGEALRRPPRSLLP